MSISCSGSLVLGFVPPQSLGLRSSDVAMVPLFQHFPPCTKLEEQNMENNAANSSICLYGRDRHTFICSYLCSMAILFISGQGNVTFHVHGTARTRDTGDYECCLPPQEEQEKRRRGMVTTVTRELLEAGGQSVGQHAKVRSTWHMVNWGFT